MDPENSPRSLQTKVQFDIRYYFCRRGGENIHEMTPETFELQFDVDTRIAYVKKRKDKQTKNHKECDQEIVTGFMPQMLDITTAQPHKLCPVRSFEIYISKLNPKCKSLWQQPLKKIPDDISAPWYKNEPVGHNPIEKFFSKLSKDLGLSKKYSNHCIRVTGTTNLARSNFSPKQIMSVTGYKSIESLAIYQKVRADEKLMMGMSLTYSLLHPDEVCNVQALPQQVNTNVKNPILQIPEAPKTPMLALPKPATSETA